MMLDVGYAKCESKNKQNGGRYQYQLLLNEPRPKQFEIFQYYSDE